MESTRLGLLCRLHSARGVARSSRRSGTLPGFPCQAKTPGLESEPGLLSLGPCIVLNWATMHPILKKRSGEVACRKSSFSAKSCNLRGRRRRRSRAEGPAGLKTRVLRKSPPRPSDASQRSAASPGHLCPEHSQNPSENLAKHTGKQKRGAKLGEPQKTDEKKAKRVTFNSTSTDLGK